MRPERLLPERLSCADPVLDTKALLAWNRDTAVLSFRGTASVKNAFSDLKAWMAVHEPRRGVAVLGSTPKVHRVSHPS